MSDIKLWLDTEREPDVNWVWSRTSEGAITMLRGGCVELISFAPDQYPLVNPVIDWMMENFPHSKCRVHSSTSKAQGRRKLLRIPPQPDPMP